MSAEEKARRLAEMRGDAVQHEVGVALNKVASPIMSWCR